LLSAGCQEWHPNYKSSCSNSFRKFTFGECSQHGVTAETAAGQTENSRATVFLWQILPNSAAQFVKFRGIIIPQILYIPRQVGVVVLKHDTSEYKEFVVT